MYAQYSGTDAGETDTDCAVNRHTGTSRRVRRVPDRERSRRWWLARKPRNPPLASQDRGECRGRCAGSVTADGGVPRDEGHYRTYGVSHWRRLCGRTDGVIGCIRPLAGGRFVRRTRRNGRCVRGCWRSRHRSDGWRSPHSPWKAVTVSLRPTHMPTSVLLPRVSWTDACDEVAAQLSSESHSRRTSS